MAKSLGFGTPVLIAADGAGVGGIALGRTGGSSHLVSIAVSLQLLLGLTADAAQMAVAVGGGFQLDTVMGGDGQGHGPGGSVIGLSRISVPVAIHGIGEFNLELSIIGSQRLRGPCHIVGQVLAGAIGVLSGDGKSGGIKVVILVIGRFFRIRGFQRVDCGAHGH